jgi:hypothetical protein
VDEFLQGGERFRILAQDMDLVSGSFVEPALCLISVCFQINLAYHTLIQDQMVGKNDGELTTIIELSVSG